MGSQMNQSGPGAADQQAAIDEFGGRRPWRIGDERRPLGVATLEPAPETVREGSGCGWSGAVYRDGVAFFSVDVYPDDEPFAELIAYLSPGPLDRRMRCALWLARARRYGVHEFFWSFREDLGLIEEDPIVCVSDGATPTVFDPRVAHMLWHSRRGGGVAVRCDYLGVECGRCLGCKSRDRAEPTTASRVYFVQAADGGPVKIGRSADPLARVASLQTANPDHLRILATMPGGSAVERALHRTFEAHRVRPDGEWFHPAPEVLAFVRELGGRPA